MNYKNIGAIIFCSLLLSSCGLIEKFKTSEQPSSSANENTVTTNAPSDDLFSTSAEDPNALTENHTDAPSNVTTNPEMKADQVADNDDLKALQNEFTGSAPAESQVKVAEEKEPTPPLLAKSESKADPAVDSKIPMTDTSEFKDEMKQQVKETPKTFAKNKKTAPLKIKEEAPVIADTETTKVSGTGEIKNYKVQKGETLMQIAFKLYGDISRWKDLRKLNGDKLSSNAALRNNLTIKYEEPETPFVWNPEGTPYVIKNGETLGIISNNVYHTPKKWKSIYENNKPLIKNPNVIYAGFTLYYKGAEMANYVQPKKEQPKVVRTNTPKRVEEIKIENALSEIEKLDSGMEIRNIKSATVRAPAQESGEEIIPDTSSSPPPTMPDESGDQPIED